LINEVAAARPRQLDLRTLVLRGRQVSVKPLALDRQIIRRLAPQGARKILPASLPEVKVLDNGIVVPSLIRSVEAWTKTWLARFARANFVDNGRVNPVGSDRNQKFAIVSDNEFRDKRNVPVARYAERMRIATDPVITTSRRGGVTL
jgi:hypothetical protein